MSERPPWRKRWLYRPITPGAARAVITLFVLSFLLAGASFWLSVRTVQGQIASRASVVQLCQAGNESRAQQITLWTHLIQISVPPPHETAAQRARREKLVRDFLAFVRQVFAERDCTARYGG